MHADLSILALYQAYAAWCIVLLTRYLHVLYLGLKGIGHLRSAMDQ